MKPQLPAHCEKRSNAVPSSGGSRPSDRGGEGGGGHPDPEIRWGPVSKICFWPFGSQFGLNIRRGRGGAPWTPPLDPPLPSVL